MFGYFISYHLVFIKPPGSVSPRRTGLVSFMRFIYVIVVSVALSVLIMDLFNKENHGV